MNIKVRTFEHEPLGKLPMQNISTVFLYISGQCFRIKEVEGELHLSSEDGFLEIHPMAANCMRIGEYHG